MLLRETDEGTEALRLINASDSVEGISRSSFLAEVKWGPGRKGGGREERRG